MLRTLLQYKASASVPDAFGDTPMHYACYTGNCAAVRILLEAGASPFVPNISGVTPVAAAAEDGQWALILTVARLIGGPTPAVPEAERLSAEARLAEAGFAGLAGLDAVPILPPAPLAVVVPPPQSLVGTLGSLFTGSPKTGGAGASPSGYTDGNGLPPPALVSGLDFSRGVIMHGEVSKKRANKVLSWRPKYYVASALYSALFFWTGTKSHIEGLIKKVRFETLLKTRHLPDKKNGRRFNIKVVTGRSMELMAVRFPPFHVCVKQSTHLPPTAKSN